MSTISRPGGSAADGQTLTAAYYNNDLDTIYNDHNGGITNANISASAAIAESKLAFNTSSGHDHDGTDSKLISVNRGFGFFIAGTAIAANDVDWNPTAPQNVTAVKLWAYARTAPVGSSLSVRIYNITQAEEVAAVSISSAASTGSTTSMTNSGIVAGDVLRCDVTAVGSSTAGANVSIVLEASQP